MTSNASAPSTRFASIDLLRSLACLSVVLFHYLARGPAGGWMHGVQDVPLLSQLARYGYLGVHLFFIISGYVILWSVRDGNPRAFVASRVARLYPAFWVAVPLTAIVVWSAQDAELSVPLSHALGNLTMVPHWLGLSYVDGAYWSLAVELNFYVYVWILLRLKAMRWMEPLFALWLLVSVVDLLRPMYPVELWLDAKWAAFFVAGCVLYRMRSEGRTTMRIALLIASWLVATAWTVYEGLTAPSPLPRPDPVVLCVLVTLIFAVLSAVMLGKWDIRSNSFTVWAGALTYPVYLVHENIGYVLHAVFLQATGDPWLALLLVVVSVMAISLVIHQGVERKLGPWLRRQLSAPRVSAANPV